jgi:hypothetical protein
LSFEHLRPKTAVEHGCNAAFLDLVNGDAQIRSSYPPSAEILRAYGGDVARAPATDMDRSTHWLDWVRVHPFA